VNPPECCRGRRFDIDIADQEVGKTGVAPTMDQRARKTGTTSIGECSYGALYSYSRIHFAAVSILLRHLKDRMVLRVCSQWSHHGPGTAVCEASGVATR